MAASMSSAGFGCGEVMAAQPKMRTGIISGSVMSGISTALSAQVDAGDGAAAGAGEEAGDEVILDDLWWWCLEDDIGPGGADAPEAGEALGAGEADLLFWPEAWLPAASAADLQAYLPCLVLP